MDKPNQKKTKPQINLNRADDFPNFDPKQHNTSSTPPKKSISPTNQALRKARTSPVNPSSATTSPLSNPHLQQSTRKSLTPTPQESKKKFLDIDLKNIAIPSFFESPKGSPRSPKNNNSESPRLKGSEPLGCESWEVVSKQDLDYRETLATERFLRFLHGQSIDAKQKFASISNTDYLFSDREEESTSVKFIRLEELERLMKESHPKNEKQYIFDWLNEIPQPVLEKIPENPAEKSPDVLANQFQSFKSVFNQMSEKIFKKWILSHRLERIVIDLIQKYQETKKQVEDFKQRESQLGESIRESVKMEVQRQLRNFNMKEDLDTVQSKEMLLKEIVQKEMEKITKKVDFVLSEMKEKNMQNKNDNSIEEAVDKILKETEEQFTFLTTSIGEIKKDVNDLKLKRKTEARYKPESANQDLEKLKQYLESKTKEFTNNILQQLENTSNLLERCNSIEKNSEKKMKELQTRIERELKEMRNKIDHSHLSETGFISTDAVQHFQTVEKNLNGILLKSKLTEEESRRTIESIIKSNLIHSGDIQGLHIKQKALESKFEETNQKIENLEMKQIDDTRDIKKLSDLLETVSPYLKHSDQTQYFESNFKLQSSCLSKEIENVKKEILEKIKQEQKSKFDEIIQSFSEKEADLRIEILQTSNNFSEYSKHVYNNLSNNFTSLSGKIDGIIHKVETFQTNHQEIRDDKFNNMSFELDTLRNNLENGVSDLKKQLSKLMDNNCNEEAITFDSELFQRIASLEAKLDQFRADVSKEMQINMKCQNDSNKCMESSILNLENTRNENIILTQMLERKIIENEKKYQSLEEALSSLSQKYVEIDNYLSNLKQEQSNISSCELSSDSIIKDLCLKILNFEKSLMDLKDSFSCQESYFSKLKTELTDSKLLSQHIDDLKNQIEMVKQQNSSILTYRKTVENNLADIVDIIKKQENIISSNTKNLENLKKQYVDEINQIKSWYSLIKTKVEGYSVAIETLDLWKQSFNDSMVVVKQKAQESLLNYNTLLSRSHEIILSQQKLEADLCKIQDSNLNISLELSGHLQSYKNQYDEFGETLSTLKSSKNLLEQKVSSSQVFLSQQIETTNSKLMKFIDHEFKYLNTQSQTDHTTLSDLVIKFESYLKPILSIREQYEELSNRLETCKNELQVVQTNMNGVSSNCSALIENQNQKISFVEEETKTLRNNCRTELIDIINTSNTPLHEKIQKLEETMISFSKKNESPEIDERFMNELESRIPSFSSFELITGNIRKLQDSMINVEKILPQIRSDISNGCRLTEKDITTCKNNIEILYQQLEQINSFKLSTSTTIEVQERTILFINNRVASMEEDILKTKVIMKEENSIQKNLLNSMLDWKNSIQEQVAIFNQDFSVIKEELLIREQQLIKEISNCSTLIVKNDELVSSIEELKALDVNIQTMKKSILESNTDIIKRLSYGEEKVNELEQNITDIYKKLITLYGQLDMQGEATKLMENIVDIQEVLSESYKKLKDMCDNTLEEMENHAQSLITDFFRLVDQKVVRTHEALNCSQSFENQNRTESFQNIDFESMMTQLGIIQAELLRQQESNEIE